MPEYAHEDLCAQLGTQSSQTVFVLTMIAAAEILLPVLACRKWGLLASLGFSVICSDRPVTTITRSNNSEPTAPGQIADLDLDIIVPLMPSYVCSERSPQVPSPLIDDELVSKLNSCLARGAARFLFSKELDLWRRLVGSDGTGLQEFLRERWAPTGDAS